LGNKNSSAIVIRCEQLKLQRGYRFGLYLQVLYQPSLQEEMYLQCGDGLKARELHLLH